MAPDDLLDALQHSDQHLIRAVDSLTSEQWADPSLLPGWTRAHVVAHLALNAEGFVRALGGVQDGDELPVYDSNEARDADIADLAEADPSEIRDRYFGATTRLRHLFGALTADQWLGSVNRLPTGPSWPIEGLPAARRMEVEVHHADLALDYTPADWPEDFTVTLLGLLTKNHADSPTTGTFAIEATDLDRSWPVGADKPVVSGKASALAWWLIGRSGGQDLTSTDSPLPTLGPWTRHVPKP